jgi:hypothetical protein
VNRAGFVIHSAIHAARDDAHCIMHVHTTAGCAVSCKEEGLRHDNFYSAMLYGDVAYHDYEGVTTNLDEQPRLVASLGSANHLILRNHGLLVVGPNIPTAFNRLWTLQRACEIQLASDAGQGPNRSIPTDVLRTVPQTRVAASGDTHRLIFDTMLRRAGHHLIGPPTHFAPAACAKYERGIAAPSATMRRMNPYRIGSGAGYSGDRIDPAQDLAERGRLNALVFECLAERTIALAQLRRSRDPQAGLRPAAAARMRAVLPACLRQGVTIISNMGAANPLAAGRGAGGGARAGPASRLRVAVVTGDDVLAWMQANDAPLMDSCPHRAPTWAAG